MKATTPGRATPGGVQAEARDKIYLDTAREPAAAAAWHSLTSSDVAHVHPPVPAGADRASAAAAGLAADWMADCAAEGATRIARAENLTAASANTVANLVTTDAESAANITASVKGAKI